MLDRVSDRVGLVLRLRHLELRQLEILGRRDDVIDRRDLQEIRRECARIVVGHPVVVRVRHDRKEVAAIGANALANCPITSSSFQLPIPRALVRRDVRRAPGARLRRAPRCRRRTGLEKSGSLLAEAHVAAGQPSILVRYSPRTTTPASDRVAPAVPATADPLPPTPHPPSPPPPHPGLLPSVGFFLLQPVATTSAKKGTLFWPSFLRTRIASKPAQRNFTSRRPPRDRLQLHYPRTALGGRSRPHQRERRKRLPGLQHPPKRSPLFRVSLQNPGSVLLSHRVAPAVPSALESLTSVFGMGTGVTSPV